MSSEILDQRIKLLFVTNVDWFFISHRLPVAVAALKAGYEVHIATLLTGPIEEAVGATATTIAFNNGIAAGQEVPHLHCHIIPRFEHDGGKSVHSIVKEPSSPSADFSDIVMSIKNLI